MTVEKRTIKVLAIGVATAGLSAGLATTALAASGRSATTPPASAAAVRVAEGAQGSAVNSASSPHLTVPQLTAEIRQLEQLQADGRATAAQIVKLHQLKAELAQLTAKH